MKKILTLTFIIVWSYSNCQTSLPNTDPSTISTGISYQNAPSTSAWTYSYGTKLTVWGSNYRNFEIMNTSKSANSTLALRTYDPNIPGWTDWREFLFMNSSGNVGIGTNSPETKLHIQSGNYGVKSSNASAIIESNDTYLDLLSSSDLTWGSGLNFIEGNGSSNTDMWSIVRQTTLGSGNSNLEFKFGTNDNPTSNATKFTLRSDGQASFRQSGNTGQSTTILSIENAAQGITNTSSSIDFIHYSQTNVKRVAARIVAVNEDSFNGSNRNDTGLALYTLKDGGSIEALRIANDGNIGIGTTSPTEKLEVAGTIYSQEVRVDIDAGTGPDYVFEPTYHLRTLEETEAYIKVNKHLPEVPAAAEMEANGVQLGEMDMLLLKKIEELTLHLIAKDKELKTLESEHKAEIESLIKRIEKLEKH